MPAARILDDVYVVRDTCNVYVLVSGDEAIAVDFGSGQVLDELDALGVRSVTDVLLTHHHRDQAQGLARAVAHGARVWVPHAEQDLVARVDEHWQMRQVDGNYDLRQDRFSLLERVPIAGTVVDYTTRRFGGYDVTAVPTPGHTPGSVSYLVDVGGGRLAFTGDLVYGPGKVWSLAAMQWTYSGLEGAGATVLSLRDLLEREPTLVLPSHGEPIDDPAAAFSSLERRLRRLVDARRDRPWNVDRHWDSPFTSLSPHLLRNMTSHATTYVLLSDSGGALVLDYGFDMITGFPPPTADRAARRPWLPSLRVLKRDYGVDRVEVAIPTHYHDDHVAAFNLLRDTEGTQVWAEQSVARILREPRRFDLPCLWRDPIAVDCEVAPGEPVHWREYELTMYPLPGHTLYAVAIAFEVDGRRVVATGDQQDGAWEPGVHTELLNFQYQNRFRIDDFVESAALYRELRPDLMISGHWAPRQVDDAYLDMLAEKGREIADVHRALLPLDDVDFDAEGVGLRIEPYQATVEAGASVRYDVEIVNPFGHDDTAEVEFVTPSGWAVTPPRAAVELPARARGVVHFDVTPCGPAVRRARVAADLTVGARRFGQHAEALVDVTTEEESG